MSERFKKSTLIGIGFASLGIAWAICMVHAIWNGANKMIGFSFGLFLAPPVVLMMALTGLILIFSRLRQRAIGVGLLVGAGTILGTLMFGYQINRLAYSWHVAQYGQENTAALARLLDTKSISLEEFLTALPDGTNLHTVNGARWYATNKWLSPQGVFLGANVAGIPHLQIEKKRHGYLGLAYAKDLEIIKRLNPPDWVKYKPTTTSNLWIWTFGP